MHKGFTRKYLRGKDSRKRFSRGIVIRKRKPFELFWSEILVGLFVIFLLIMLAVNYVSNQEYVRQNATLTKVREVDIGVSIQKESDLCPVLFEIDWIMEADSL